MISTACHTQHLHVVNANNSWVQSLAASMPESWVVWQYRIYSPQWLPGGARDFIKCLKTRKLGERLFETWVVVPGWNKWPHMSSIILGAVLRRRIRAAQSSPAILYSFPFFSHIAAAAQRWRSDLLQAYWAHDAFAFYDFPSGYIEAHERRLVPLCKRHFAMTPLLAEDYRVRFPNQPFDVLRDAVSKNFLASPADGIAGPMQKIRAQGRPVVGSIGQINNSYDWDIIQAAAEVHSKAQFVFIGNLVEEGAVTERIRAVLAKDNVHWLGRVAHEELPSYLAGFDICLNPLRLNDHNQRRDPLRIYDYLTTTAPIYSLNFDGSKHHGEHVVWFEAPEELVRAIGQIPHALDSSAIAARRRYIEQNTWEARAGQLCAALEAELEPAAP